MAKPRRSPTPNRILELRRAARLSQRELGDQVGLTQSQVGKIERGEVAIADYLVPRFAVALNVKPWEIAQPPSQRHRILIELFEALPVDKQNTLLTLGRALAEDADAYDSAMPATKRGDKAA